MLNERDLDEYLIWSAYALAGSRGDAASALSRRPLADRNGGDQIAT